MVKEMKLTKSQLKEIIKEEMKNISEEDASTPSAGGPRDRSQTATVGRASSLAMRQKATEKVTDPVAAAQLLFKQLQGFSTEIDKATVMRNLIRLVKQSSQ
jgi:hypothetical protein